MASARPLITLGLAAAPALAWIPASRGVEPPAVDAWIARTAEANKWEIAPLCLDQDFLRRVTLDLTGVVPRATEAADFLEDPALDKRDALIERLLASDEFNERWGRFLLQLCSGRRGIPDDFHNGHLLHRWLVDAVRGAMPYDEIVRRMLTAEGLTSVSPEVNFLLRYRVSPPDIAGAVARNFLGRQWQCAQCHDHPFEDFTQERFWNLAAYFARTRRFYLDDETYEAGVAERLHSRLMMPPGGDPNLPAPEMVNESAPPPVLPRWAYGAAPATPEAGRADLARLVTDPVASPDFARNLVNRVWAELFGQGLVEPLDDLTRSATHPELLQELADFFVASGYDLRTLVRAIVDTQTYQRARSTSATPAPAAAFVAARARPLDADQLFASLIVATGYLMDEDNSEAGLMAELDEEGLQQASDERAYADYYPPEFCGGPPRTLQHTLTWFNGGEVLAAADEAARLAMKLHGRPVGPAHLEWLYLALLARLPDATETGDFLAYAASEEGKRRALADVAWAILNSTEFRYTP
jgi:hypothetical protein